MVQPVQAYISALTSCVVQGQPFSQAARQFVEATNTFCTQV